MSERARNVDQAGWAQLTWLVVVLAAWCGGLLALRLDPDYTAGELLDHLVAWHSGHALYPVLGTVPPFRVLNYPPLVLVLVRGLSSLGVPELTAGRLVNDLGLVVLLAGVTWWIRARGARGAALAGAVGLLGASFPLLYAAGQLHIELWAEAGTVWGFALLDRGRFRGAGALAGWALATGCFAKQSQAVLVLVALAWVWSRRREVARAGTAAFVLTGLVGAALITLAWGPQAWKQMVTYTVGTYSLANLGQQMLSYLAPWIVLLAFAVRQARVEGRGVWKDAAWWYWIGALVWAFSAARRGSSYPYFLDLYLATTVWVGPRLFGAASRRPSRMWVVLLAGQVVLADLGVAVAATVNLTRLERMQAHLPSLCALLEGRGPVLAEEPGVLRACGHAAMIDPFITTSLAHQGLWNPAPFERSIGRAPLDLAVLPFDPRAPVSGVHAERWTPGALAAFRTASVVRATPAGEWVLRW